MKPEPDKDRQARGLEATRHFWQRRVRRPVSREDAREMIENVGGFLGVLREWEATELSQGPRAGTVKREEA